MVAYSIVMGHSTTVALDMGSVKDYLLVLYGIML